MTKKELIEKIKKVEAKGYIDEVGRLPFIYAIEIIEKMVDIDNFELDGLEKTLLGGSPNWVRYSFGGLSLVSNYEIKERIKPYLEAIGKLEDEETNNNLMTIQGAILQSAYKLIEAIIYYN